MKIETKINLAMCGAFFVGLVCASAGAYTLLHRDALAESAQNGRILMEAATATRQYTASRIGPLLADKMAFEFLPDAIPSFAAQTNAAVVQSKLPDYIYREPTLNPISLKDKAEGWEADLIEEFRANPNTQQVQFVRDSRSGQFLTMARPLKVGSKACLTCHSTPEAAPPTMVALYGREHGFGWKLGETVGAQVVSIPLAVPQAHAYRALVAFAGGLASTFILMILVVNVLLRYIVVKPMVRISEVATELSLGNMDAPEIETGRNDEIGLLASAFNRMRRSLQSALDLLEGSPT